MNKKAFTLIEIIAIIALLGIISILVLPKIGDSIEARKEKQYNNIVKTIESAAKVYYADNKNITKVLLSDLIDNDYLTSGLMDPRDDQVMVGCVYVYLDIDGYNNYIYMNDETNCSAEQLYFTLVIKPMDGIYLGTTNNTSYQMIKDGTQELFEPTRDYYDYDGWNYSCAGCTVSPTSFKMGTSNVVLTAKWTPKIYNLTTDLDGGTISVTPPTTMAYKELFSLATPTKTGYTFIRWDVTVGGTSESSIASSTNTLTMGHTNTTIKAIFEPNAWQKTIHTCNRTPATYTVTTKTCARTFVNYTKITYTCLNNGTSYYLSRSETYPTTCSTSASFTCYSATLGSSYTVTCASNYNYYFNTATSTNSTCTVGSSFTCNSTTLNNSYISACTESTYNYAFTTSATQINQCTATSSFTCDGSTYENTYTTCVYTG